jgi:hypothetical protein
MRPKKLLADGVRVSHDCSMPELKDFASSVAIIVSSCDSFFDAWRPFAIFFRKFWPDCPLDVLLIVNELRIRSQLLRPIAVGPDRGWASNLRCALQQLDRSHVMYLQEDYFLTAPIRSEQLASDFSYAVERGVDSFCFRARTNLENGFESLNERFGVVPSASDGRTRCQATLWKREALLSILREGETAWDFEAKGSARTRDMLVLSYATREDAPIRYLMSAISRGLWNREAIDMCAEHKVRLTENFRQTRSPNRLIESVRRSVTRRRLVHELAQARRTQIDLDAA